MPDLPNALPSGIVSDQLLVEHADTIFRNAPVFEKTGNYVAAIQNTSGKPITYTITNAQGQEVQRVIPPGYFAKVSPTGGGELNVQVTHDGQSSYSSLNNPEKTVPTLDAAAAAAKADGVKVSTKPEHVERALANLLRNNPGLSQNQVSVVVAPERNRVAIVTAPSDFTLAKPGWGAGATQTVKKGDALQLTLIGSREVYANGIAAGTLGSFVGQDGRTALETITASNTKVPVADTQVIANSIPAAMAKADLTSENRDRIGAAAQQAINANPDAISGKVPVTLADGHTHNVTYITAEDPVVVVTDPRTGEKSFAGIDKGKGFQHAGGMRDIDLATGRPEVPGQTALRELREEAGYVPKDAKITVTGELKVLPEDIRFYDPKFDKPIVGADGRPTGEFELAKTHNLKPGDPFVMASRRTQIDVTADLAALKIVPKEQVLTSAQKALQAEGRLMQAGDDAKHIAILPAKNVESDFRAGKIPVRTHVDMMHDALPTVVPPTAQMGTPRATVTPPVVKSSTVPPNFSVGEGRVSVSGVVGSPSNVAPSQRAIVVPVYAEGSSGNLANYGFRENSPEIAALDAHIKANGNLKGAWIAPPQEGRPRVIFAPTFGHGAATSEAITAATASSMRIAQANNLTHVDFVVHDGGFGRAANGRVIDEAASSRAMARGMLGYAQTGGTASASVIQYSGSPSSSKQAFAASFNAEVALAAPVVPVPLATQPATTGSAKSAPLPTGSAATTVTAPVTSSPSASVPPVSVPQTTMPSTGPQTSAPTASQPVNTGVVATGAVKTGDVIPLTALVVATPTTTAPVPTPSLQPVSLSPTTPSTAPQTATPTAGQPANTGATATATGAVAAAVVTTAATHEGGAQPQPAPAEQRAPLPPSPEPTPRAPSRAFVATSAAVGYATGGANLALGISAAAQAEKTLVEARANGADAATIAQIERSRDVAHTQAATGVVLTAAGTAVGAQVGGRLLARSLPFIGPATTVLFTADQMVNAQTQKEATKAAYAAGGSVAGAAVLGGLGVFTGPLAPVAVPVLATVGGIVGGPIGSGVGAVVHEWNSTNNKLAEFTGAAGESFTQMKDGVVALGQATVDVGAKTVNAYKKDGVLAAGKVLVDTGANIGSAMISGTKALATSLYGAAKKKTGLAAATLPSSTVTSPATPAPTSVATATQHVEPTIPVAVTSAVIPATIPGITVAQPTAPVEPVAIATPPVAEQPAPAGKIVRVSNTIPPVVPATATSKNHFQILKEAAAKEPLRAGAKLDPDTPEGKALLELRGDLNAIEKANLPRNKQHPLSIEIKDGHVDIGPKTTARVKDIQTRADLKRTGVIDPPTIDAIAEAKKKADAKNGVKIKTGEVHQTDGVTPTATTVTKAKPAAIQI